MVTDDSRSHPGDAVESASRALPPVEPRVLIADDQAEVLEALQLLLDGAGMVLETSVSPAGVLAAVEAREFDVALIDLTYARAATSGREGLSLLSRLQASDPTLSVVVMTTCGSVDLAIEAIRRGARDFVQKPWDPARVLATVRAQTALVRALRKAQRLDAENVMLRGEAEPEWVAESVAMQGLLRSVAHAGPSDGHVLIVGEHGTGKGSVARELVARSSRAEGPLIVVSPAGLSEDVLERRLFGQADDASATGCIGRIELADRGTLFVDELASMPRPAQARLLRVIETGVVERPGSSRPRRVETRIVAATTANLHAEAAAGRFLPDLLFRLNAVEIRVPPLRERREDLPRLAGQFLRQHARYARTRVSGFEPAALQLMLDHTWPGNLRELDHAIERAVLVGPGPLVRPGDLGLRTSREPSGRLEDLSLEEVESLLVKKAMHRFDGNVTRAAAALGLSRSALYRRLQRLGL